MAYEKVNELAKSFHIAACCQKCVVACPDRPVGEYSLLQFTMGQGGVFHSEHSKCKRDWFIAKNQTSRRWFKIRPANTYPGPSGIYGVCEYAIDDSDVFIEKDRCPAGDCCVYAHSEVECNMWSDMYRLGLKFSDLKCFVRNKPDRVPQSEESRKITETDMATASLVVSSVSNGSTIPQDAIRPGRRYAEEVMMHQVGQKLTINICVTKVTNPDLFYFQKLENVAVAENCFQEMSAFYNSAGGENYQMLPDDLHRELPVAKRTKSKGVAPPRWQRGEIVDYATGPFEMIEVADVDFGGIDYVKIEDIRLLKESYFAFPRQAFESALAYVCPVNGSKWTKESVEFTQSFLNRRSLMANVVGIKNSKLALVVGDNSDPGHIVYLTNLLVKKRHASSFKLIKPVPFGAKTTNP